MAVFLTNQKKLAAAAGITAVHLSEIKNGKNGISSDVAEKLENLTGIKRVVWASASRRQKQLDISLKKFLREEKEREVAAIANISRTNNSRR